jgi:hypothetical protein
MVDSLFAGLNLFFFLVVALIVVLAPVFMACFVGWLISWHRSNIEHDRWYAGYCARHNLRP